LIEDYSFTIITAYSRKNKNKKGSTWWWWL